MIANIRYANDGIFEIVCIVLSALSHLPFNQRSHARFHSLFYLDPTYWNCEMDYGKDVFARSDFEQLAKQLKKIKGRFIMSINDVPEIHKLFAFGRHRGG